MCVCVSVCTMCVLCLHVSASLSVCGVWVDMVCVPMRGVECACIGYCAGRKKRSKDSRKEEEEEEGGRRERKKGRRMRKQSS